MHESIEKTTNGRNRILSVEADELETWAAPPFFFSQPFLTVRLLSTGPCLQASLRHRALLGKWPEIFDISSKRHDFVSNDENGAGRPRARPTMLAFPSIHRFLFGYLPTTDGYMKKIQKTQKELEFQPKNKENRQKAGLKSGFLGVDRDKSGRIRFFWVVGRDVGFRSPNRDCPDEIGTVGKYGIIFQVLNVSSCGLWHQ